MLYWMVCLPPLHLSQNYFYLQDCKNRPKRVSYLTSVHGPMALFAPSALQEEAPVQGGACWAESSSHEPSVNAKSRFWLSAHTQASCYAFCHCLPVSLVSLFFFFLSMQCYHVSLFSVKNLPAMQETGVWSLGQEDPLEQGMATHSSILAWRIPWTEESGRLQSLRLQRVGHNSLVLVWATNSNT